MQGKIVQLASSSDNLFALDEHGVVWRMPSFGEMNNRVLRWTQLPKIGEYKDGKGIHEELPNGSHTVEVRHNLSDALLRSDAERALRQSGKRTVEKGL